MKKKMFVKNKKVLLIVLIVALTVVLAMGTFAGTTFGLYKAEKKAVIILPGLFASGLYDSETGEAVWDPFEHIDKGFGDFMNTEGEILMENIVPLAFDNIVKEELNKMLANNNAGAEDSLFNIMAMNEDGSPAVASVTGVPWEREGRLKYGAINAQKDMYQSLYEKYGQDYEVEIFNYDFRLDNRDNAELLENHINKKKYNDIILVSHSNGGHVAGMYLAKSSENRDKVTKYISYNAPYMGAISAITILENIDVHFEAGMTALT
ncbi:MAG: lipase/acyltransferase domain-containing protein, partial [Bacillota bacterium]